MHEQLRALPLQSVLQQLGVTTAWKTRKGGTEWAGTCPIHKAKNNQTSFSFDAEGRFHCFSCNGKGKGAIDLVMAVRQIGFQAAVEELKGISAACPSTTRTTEATPETRAPELSQSNHQAFNAPFKGSYEKFFKPHPWLTARGIKEDTLKLYGSGYYENQVRRSQYNGSVMLKISRYSDGDCVGYLSRNIGDVASEKPKYRFPPGFQKSLELFGAWELKLKRPIRVLYLVESPFCVLKFHQLNIPAVSPFGWSLSDQQIDIIKSLCFGVVYLPDTNKQSEIADSLRRLSLHVWVKSPLLPSPISDPESLSLEQIKALA